MNSQVRLYFFTASRNQVALHRSARRWVPQFRFCSHLVSQIQVQSIVQFGRCDVVQQLLFGGGARVSLLALKFPNLVVAIGGSGLY